MVDRAERDPTMEEIVVALRETRRAAGGAPPFTVVGGRYGGSQAPLAAVDGRNGAAGATDVADLRDGEIQRLLNENAQLNQRVVSLLKVIEHEQARGTPSVATRGDRDIVHDVRAAVESELRPVLDVLLRLLEQFRSARGGRELTRPAVPCNDGAIIDLDAPNAHE
jgi:hypothetical protein